MAQSCSVKCVGIGGKWCMGEYIELDEVYRVL